MEPYAIVEASGKQYKAVAGEAITIDRLEAEAGSTVTLSPVLAVSDGPQRINYRFAFF